jgi:putative chitinase
MKTHDILNESLSAIVYHYTSLHSAVSILSTGKFELSSVAGSVEEQYSPPGYPYFMSTTRTKFGAYHERVSNGAVMFDLDGRYYNSRYPAAPVDYWSNPKWSQRDTSVSLRASEAEDRIFSKTPTIPIDGTTSIHVYVEPMDSDKREKWAPSIPSVARKVLLLAKKRGIPVYLYEDDKMWRRQDPRGRVTIGKRDSLSGPDLYKGPVPKTRRAKFRTHSFSPWLELINLNDTKKLGKKAGDIAYSIGYGSPYNIESTAHTLKNDFHNARKPSSGNDREGAIKVLDWMGKNKVTSVSDFVNKMAQKWGDIKKAENQRERDRLRSAISAGEREGLDEDWRDWAKAAMLSGALASGNANADSLHNRSGDEPVPQGYRLMDLPNGKAVAVPEKYSDEDALNAITKKYPQLLDVTPPPNAKLSKSIIDDAKKLLAHPYGNYFARFAKANGVKGTELIQLLAQSAHETNNFNDFIEKGDKDYFKQYDPKFSPERAKRLGNTKPGDGAKYRGRGFLHLTGRDNYTRAGQALGLPLAEHPELVAKPEIAAQTALWFWENHVKPKVKDYSNTASVTRPINKGLAGLSNRANKFAGIRNVMGKS